MPTYTVKAPDGNTYSIEGPEGATEEQVHAEVLRQNPSAAGRANYGSGGVDDEGGPGAGGVDPKTGLLRVNITPNDAPKPDDHPYIHAAERGVRDVMSGAGAVADVATLPITAAMRALGIDVTPYKELANNLADKIGLPRSETNAEKILSALNEGGVLGLATAGLGGAVSGAGGITGAIGDALSATPVADTVASATGNASGEVAKQSGAGPLGQLAASVAGGGLGAVGAVGVPRAIESAAPLVTGNFEKTTPSDLLAAFQRQQVQPMADQVGGTASRAASGVTRMTLGGIPLAQAAEKSIATAKAARDRIAGVMGRVTDDTGAGQAAQKGANSFIKSSEAQAGRLYDAIPIAPRRLANLDNTRATLQEMTAGMESNPELSKMVADNPRLKGYLDALSPKDVLVDRHVVGGGPGQPFTAQQGGELSWQDLKRFRSIIGEIAGQPTLAQDTSQQAMRKLYGALSEDMKATATADGPKSLAAFSRANNFYRARQGRIDNVLSSILGNDLNKSPEDAFRQIQSWSREGGDAARVAQAMRSLPEDEANTVRATLFSKMGDVSPGRQDLTGKIFSPSDFATQWAKIDHRAKSVLFPDANYRQDLDDIARIADSMKRSGEFANTSKTALASNGIGLLTLALSGHPIEAGGIATTQFGAGKLLASPRFARWLASSARKPNGPATLAHINRLTAIAGSDPAIANEALALQQKLASAFVPTSAAAQSKPAPDQSGQSK